jgi:hypothetical protein
MAFSFGAGPYLFSEKGSLDFARPGTGTLTTDAQRLFDSSRCPGQIFLG